MRLSDKHFLTFFYTRLRTITEIWIALLTSNFPYCIMQRFSLLDTDQDGYLTEDNVMSVPADVVDEAFGQTLPGEVRDREWDLIYLWSATICDCVI